MIKKTEKFLEELKSWRQENPDKRSFIVIVNEREKSTAIGLEGDSTALGAAVLSSTASGQLSAEEAAILLNSADKMKYVLEHMDHFLQWCKDGKKKSADS